MCIVFKEYTKKIAKNKPSFMQKYMDNKLKTYYTNIGFPITKW